MFVEQSAGEVFCAEEHSGEIGIARRLRVRGLERASVRFYPETGTDARVRMVPNPKTPFDAAGLAKPKSCDDARGRFLELPDVTGQMLISW